MQLFHRSHRGITLTDKGQGLLPYAQRMLSLVENARAAVANSRDVGGSLQIGALQSTATARLPDVLKVYAARHAQVDISVETGTSAELTAKVLESRLDGAFVTGVESHPDLDVVTSFVEELVVIGPTACRSVRAYLKQSGLPKLLVFKVGAATASASSDTSAMKAWGCSARMEFGTLDGIIGCVAAGLGISMLPRSVVERSVRGQGGVYSSTAEAVSVRRNAIRHPPGAGSLAGVGPSHRRNYQSAGEYVVVRPPTSAVILVRRRFAHHLA